MNQPRWTPHVTVATIVEKDNQYLLVHEAPDGHSVYNQPAGHLEDGESLIEAAARETLEETGWKITITEYLGMYRYIEPSGITYLRHGFVAEADTFYPDQPLDEGIIEAVWMSYDDILTMESSMRSPMVKQLIEDYRSGKRYPLAVLNEGR